MVHLGGLTPAESFHFIELLPNFSTKVGHVESEECQIEGGPIGIPINANSQQNPA